MSARDPIGRLSIGSADSTLAPVESAALRIAVIGGRPPYRSSRTKCANRFTISCAGGAC